MRRIVTDHNMIMRKNYLLLAFLLLITAHSFSQSLSVKSNAVEQAATATPEAANAVLPSATLIPLEANGGIFEKKPLPSNQKVSPAVFYVENDKPISQQQYQQRSRKK